MYAERRGIGAAGYNLVLLKQISVMGAVTAIPFFGWFVFFFLRKTECFTGPPKGEGSYPEEAVSLRN